jgi:ABC transporter with metal-binding/Fe-S-binding domain ATP-binding protein
MKTAILFSGGKDSTMALYWCLQNAYTVKYLVSAFPANPDSMLFHTSNIELVRLISEAIGIELIEVPITSQDDKGETEELKKALEKLRKTNNEKPTTNYIDSIAVGGVSSNYQGKIFGKMAEELEVSLLAPYWNVPHSDLIQEAIDAGFKIIFTSVSADGLDESWLGKELNTQTFEELKTLCEKYRINIGGEGGEYCTTVIDGPIFKKSIKIIESETKFSGMSGKYFIKKAELTDK